MARKDEVDLEPAPPVALSALVERPCAYCGNPPIGAVNGRAHCREHAYDAMDGVKPLTEIKARK